jgi:hypothetical protein
VVLVVISWLDVSAPPEQLATRAVSDRSVSPIVRNSRSDLLAAAIAAILSDVLLGFNGLYPWVRIVLNHLLQPVCTYSS